MYSVSRKYFVGFNVATSKFVNAYNVMSLQIIVENTSIEPINKIAAQSLCRNAC